MDSNTYPSNSVDGHTSLQKRKYGLVLSGGGMRFATHAGVMTEMAGWAEDGKPWLDKFDVLVGTSAGALYSGLYAAGYSPVHIAAFAPLFARPELKQSLFDWNYDKAAAVFLRHDVSYLLGATGGNGVLSFLETVLSKEMPEELMEIYPQPNLVNLDGKALNKVSRRLLDAWKKRQRNQGNYDDLLTFADCKKQLFLIGVNAYTGQKTVFGKLPKATETWDTLDKRAYRSYHPSYINDKGKWQKELSDLEYELGLTEPLQFRRYENRLYHGFDTNLYRGTEQDGPQLPLALAIRASVSMPVFFEPAYIQRQIRPPSEKHEHDLFLDGGVDDNFSLSVAADENLGSCTHILGISLGNLGYRFPDPNATKNILTILLNTTNYLGEAVLDLEQHDVSLQTCHTTIINALPSIGAELTDTEKINDLITEARGIAREFWEEAHNREGQAAPTYPGSIPIPVEGDRIFSDAAGIRIYCSRTARTGTQSFKILKQGEADLPNPRLGDVVIGIPSILYRSIRDSSARLWTLGYIVLFFMAFGAVTLAFDVVDVVLGRDGSVASGFFRAELAGSGWLVVRIVLALFALIVTRLVAYWIWLRRRNLFPDTAA